MRVPLADSQRKYCFICHADISLAKRVKDAQGNYHCLECWQAQVDAAKSNSEDFWNAIEDLDRK